MNARSRGVGRGLVAALVLVGLMVAPVATGTGLAGGMRASGGALRAPGSMGARLGPAGVAGGATVTPGVRRGVMPGAGTAIRTIPSEGAFAPLPPNLTVRPLAPGTVIVPASSPFFFPGGVISPLIPGTVVNPLLPGTIFVPLFPGTSFFPVFPSTVFTTVFPTTIFLPAFPSTIISPLMPGIVPPLLPQFVVRPVPRPLVEVSDPAAATASVRAGAAAAPGRRSQAAAAGPAVMPVRVGALQSQSSNARALQEWVRTQNPGAHAAVTVWGATGDAVATSTTRSEDRAATAAGDDPGAIARAFGRPRHRVAFVPRMAFFDDFFSMRDGRVGFKQFRHRPAVTADFYYAHYRSDPSWFAFRHPGDYPSVYALWGWTPPWISADRVSYLPRNGLPGPSYLDYQGFGDVDSVGATNCLDGIRRAWLSGDPQPLAPFLSDQLEVRVYFSGRYEYSVPARDYYAMTVDALSATRTIAVEFDSPVWLSASDVVVTGRDGYRGPDGNPRTVYVSYRLRRVGDGWYITEAGSSLEPIEAERQGLAG